jgi:nucleoid-associated protein YgaU
MREKRGSKQARRGAFFWKIPGDVPGYQRQPDPYQGVRGDRTAEYQAPTHLDSQGSGTGKSFFGALSRSAGGDPASSAAGKSARWLVLLLLLLLVSGLGVLGYQRYFAGSPGRLGVATATKPKVFELTLGKNTRTPHSRVRIITHVVVKGDTLWDIAKTYVKDPYRYPELAKLSNIKNPDLIYPYDLVRIRIYEPQRHRK